MTAAARLALDDQPDASTFVLCDGDLGVSAGSLSSLAAAVEAGECDLAVASFARREGGGFGIAAWDMLHEPALAAARREALEPADETLRIVPAELGDDAGLVGAGLVAFEALDGER